MRMEELQNSLEAHEQRLIERRNADKSTNQGINQALQARSDQKVKGRGSGRGRGCSRSGRGRGKNTNSYEKFKEENISVEKDVNKRGGRQSKGRGRKICHKRNIQCYTCKKYGHYYAECWHNEDMKKNKNDEAANLAQNTGDSESDHVLLMSTIKQAKVDLCWRMTWDRCEKETNHALGRCDGEPEHVLLSNKMSHASDDGEPQHVLLLNETRHAVDDSCSWYLDMRYSNHMTRRREWLVNLDSSLKSCVSFADNSSIMAEGIDRVLIACKNGKIAYMDDVLYVSTMKSNLLSLGQLLEKGYTMSMHQNHIKVFDRKQHPVIKAPLSRNRTFKVNLNAVEIQYLSTMNDDEERWV
ncbi:uncharacterized protein LOC106765984 [Vigna radiata var. radiata]|uniref:Uncharacterized protein LOC106765984 n=1 Tax=Vigna radiata var. radiata TaxID=3916 RepID=A0A1S3UJL7_VIGRR|nr:uncharacterized protein LOC106765984 [Vigna radiata var. radiata]